MATTPRTIRLDDEIWARLAAIAAADERSTASLVRKVLRDHTRPGREENPQAQPHNGR